MLVWSTSLLVVPAADAGPVAFEVDGVGSVSISSSRSRASFAALRSAALALLALTRFCLAISTKSLQAHTDFVFAVYAEELGLIGVVVLVALYALLVALMMRVARRAERVNRGFGAFVVYGVTIWVACQTFISMSVNMGLLPTKGLTLPFMSYGGSSALALCIAFGIVVRIGLEATLYDTREGRS